MALTTLTRNMRDGEIKLLDGSGSPKSLVLILDVGDLTFQYPQSTVQVKDRGSITNGHTRPGDEEPQSLSYSVKMRELLGKSEDSSEPYGIYEFIHNIGNLLTSTSSVGEQFTLKHEFKVVDPQGLKSEQITFGKVFKDDVSVSEGEDWNLINFSGTNFEAKPDIERL